MTGDDHASVVPGGTPPVRSHTWRLAPLRREGPLVVPFGHRDTKDPCPVFDGSMWHIFGSAGSVVAETWDLLHATAHAIDGAWTEQPVLELVDVRSRRVAAPGVVVEDGTLHMFVQTDFLGVGGRLEHLTSVDGATRFVRADTAITADPGCDEAGLFDAHPALVDGRRYLLYAAMNEDLTGLRWEPERYGTTTRGPDVHLAESVTNTWSGPWRRLGAIVRQEDVPYQCPVGDASYEWGLEGPQLLQLADGRLLLLAVCFLGGRRRGTRQRLFTAIADRVTGPYRMTSLPLSPTRSGWESGEIGHGTMCVHDDLLWLFYQARRAVPGPGDEGEARWRYGLACWHLADLLGPGGPLQ